MSRQEKPDQQPITRLFSHLEFDGNKLQHQPGSVLGNTALIAGTTVGAGILGLPALKLYQQVFYRSYNLTHYCMALHFNFRFINCGSDFKCNAS